MTMMDRLNEDPAEGWKPQPGDTLVGTVTAVGEREGNWGPYLCATVRDDAGKSLVFHMNKVAEDQFREQNGQIGSKVGVKYHGKKPSKGGQNYNHFVVVVENEPGTGAAPAVTTQAPSTDSADGFF